MRQPCWKVMVASCNISTFLINQTFKRKNELLRFSPFPLWSAVVPHFGPSPLYDVITPVCSDDIIAADNFQMCARDFFHYARRTLGWTASEWSHIHLGGNKRYLLSLHCGSMKEKSVSRHTHTQWTSLSCYLSSGYNDSGKVRTMSIYFMLNS